VEPNNSDSLLRFGAMVWARGLLIWTFERQLNGQVRRQNAGAIHIETVAFGPAASRRLAMIASTGASA
jgi:hypothetical protein